MKADSFQYLRDPLKLKDILWPHVRFYKQQIEIIYSVWDNDDTFVRAGNKLGKDYVAGFIALAFFLTRRPCRIVATSATDGHLRVLFGEINRFINESKVPLTVRDGGPLLVNHQDIRKVVNGKVCPISYLQGLVASPDSIAAMQGHHVAATGDGIPRTLFISDESSSVPDEYYTMARTWRNRGFIFGNPWECDNFFKHAFLGKPGTKDTGGDRPRAFGPGLSRKVFKIKAEDSPNVRYGLAQKAAGLTPDDRIILPGVKPYSEYVEDRATLDPIKQAVSLDADFYAGADVLMYPKERILRAYEVAEALYGRQRVAKGMGVDPAEGGDKSAWTVVDELGIIEQISRPTPDTTEIPRQTIALMNKYGLEPEQVAFDRGGGGKQHADVLRERGYDVRTVAFGEGILQDVKRGTTKTFYQERLDTREGRYTFKNRRAQMYGRLMELLDPAFNPSGFGIPYQYGELVRQMGPVPLKYEGEGRLYVIPKNKPTPTYTGPTLIGLIGHSPDELDSLVLAVYAMDGAGEGIEAAVG